MWESAGRLIDIVRDAGPDGDTTARELWDYYRDHPDEAVWFARAMGTVTSILVSRLAADGYTPPPAERIVDVGGSRGTLLSYLLSRAPRAAGVLFDRQEALAEAPGFLAGAGVADRVELAAGDFLREVPVGR
jgi:hypothetical protein